MYISRRGLIVVELGLETLRAASEHLRDKGVVLTHGRDHEVSQSLYLRDPGGLVIKLYVDADPALWAARPDAVDCGKFGGPSRARKLRAQERIDDTHPAERRTVLHVLAEQLLAAA